MSKFWKRFAIILSIFFGVLSLSAVIITNVFEGTIGNRLVTEINKQLESELTIKKFDLTVWSTFPNVAANFRDVLLEDTGDEALLVAENVSFRFGLFSLFGSNIQVKSVVISNGELNVVIDRNGKPNYNVFKQVESTDESPSTTTISLEQAQLDDLELFYTDESLQQKLKAHIDQVDLSGQFSSTKFTLQTKGALHSHHFQHQNDRFLVDKDLTINAKVAIDLEQGIYEMEQVDLGIEDNMFKIDGAIETWDKGPYFDLYITSEDGNIASVFQLLPEKYLKDYGDIYSTGTFFFTTTIKGQQQKNLNPEVRVEFGLKQGTISSGHLDGKFKEVSFNALYKNGKYRSNASSFFELKDLKGYFRRQLVEAQVRVDNFDDPTIDFRINGILPLEEVYGLANNPKITDGSGQVELKRVGLRGRYEDMVNTSRIARVDAIGELIFDDASLTINDEKVTVDKGRLTLKDNNMQIEDVRIEGAGSEITFNGSAFNVIPVLFADSQNTNRAELEFQAKLEAKTMDIDRLMNLQVAIPEGVKSDTTLIDSLKTERIQRRERITDFLRGTFDATIESYNLNQVEGKNFVGKLDFNNNELDILGETEAMDGTFKLDGNLFFEDRPYLKAKLDCQQVDAKEFFKQTENFGQEVLTAANVKGKLDAKILINAFWDESGHFLDDKLRVLAGVGIKEGELVNFKMLESFSTFVKIEDLKRIKFVNMENFLELRNRKLYIPVMFIQSNALNLTLSGEHTFNNDISYNMKVNAGQVVLNRMKKHDPNLKPLKAKRNGWFNLYYNIAGTLDQFEYKRSKRQVKKEFERSELRKSDIHRALEQEFGFIEFVREPADWEDIPEYEDGTPEGEEEYIDWDNNG